MLQTAILTLSQMCRVIKHLGRIKLTVVDKIKADLLVIGGGGAGLMAAGTAASRNADMNIVLIEQNRSEPCNTEIASNFIPAAGTRFQKASGVKDSVKNFVDDIAAKNNGMSDMRVTSAICSCAPEALHQLVDLFNVEIALFIQQKGGILCIDASYGTLNMLQHDNMKLICEIGIVIKFI